MGPSKALAYEVLWVLGSWVFVWELELLKDLAGLKFCGVL
jgi:hypothetical protein